MSHSKETSEAGFTIPELLVTMTVFAILSVGFLVVTINYFVLITRNNLTAHMTADSQVLLRRMTDEMRYGAGVRETNSITDTNGPTGGWTTDNVNFVIIIATPALDSDREFIINPDTGYPYNNELVYYRSGDRMFRRVLAHPGASGNTVITTCPPNIATNDCPADAEQIAFAPSMTFSLYDQDDNSTTVAQDARSVDINLRLVRETFGNPLELETNIRATLRNNF